MNSLIEKIFNKRKREKLFLFFKERNYFYKKKLPHSDKYPYTIHHPFDVLETSQKYTKLFLVGDNWLEQSTPKPIALMVGFNNWKYGFVADYLNEYRVAYTVRKLSSILAARLVFRLNPKPDVIIVWGYEENFIIREFSKYHNIPLYRMEDGFVRSALLGATHATPYSLILDKKGLYYNSTTETDLETLLNNYNFSENKKLLEEGARLLNLLIDSKISKYNMPSVEYINGLKIKRGKRIAILGQVASDKAIKYGNPDGWSSEDLIKLAKYENPEAEVLYRPHPEVYRGYQNSKLNKKSIENIAKLVSPEEPLLDFLKTVDHVYVINSLSGLEALLRGIKVTTVGSAFYGGWGLTDDRYNFTRRNRTLSLLELFIGIYLKYPRYLANVNNSIVGLEVAIYRIKADYQILEFDTYLSKDIENSNILSRPYWIQQLLHHTFEGEELLTIVNKIDFSSCLRASDSVPFKKIYLISIFGILRDNRAKSIFLSKVRNYIDLNTYSHFIDMIAFVYKEEFLLKEIFWLISQNVEITQKLYTIYSKAKKIYDEDITHVDKEEFLQKNNFNTFDLMQLKDRVNKDLSEGNYENIHIFFNIVNDLDLDNINFDKVQYIRRKLKKDILSFYNHYINCKEFDKALKLAEIMLMLGINTETMLYQLVTYFSLTLNNDAVIELSRFNQNINLRGHNMKMSYLELLALNKNSVKKMNKSELKISFFKLVSLRATSITLVNFMVSRYFEGFEKARLIECLEHSLYLDNIQSIPKAQGFIAIGRADKAVGILKYLIENSPMTPLLICAYTQGLSYENQLSIAIETIEDALIKYNVQSIYHEAIRLYILKGDPKKCLEIINLAIRNNILIGDMQLRKTYFLNRMPEKALASFQDIKLKNIFIQHVRDKYILDTNYIDYSNNKKILHLSIYGPGDEIRFASIYNKIPSLYGSVKIAISVSSKLLSIFERSFANIHFIAVDRLRSTDDIDMKKYDKVYESTLVQLLDNRVIDEINNSNHVILVTDLLSRVLPDYESFSGTPYLKNDLDKTTEFKKLLPKNTKLVGLSWRSSLSTHSRNEHYLTMQELEPLFKIEGVTFVNFQYDECDEELAWVEYKYPGKMIDIKEVDHYDDLDSVASLMKCMDLVIAPATTVVELAGALGCPTWMFSNSSEIDWRKIDKEGTDVWHNSIKIVEGDMIGDKVSLVENLTNKLIKFIG